MKITSKICRDCGKYKPITDFYRHPAMADGHLNSCKVCRNLYVSGWIGRNPDRRKKISLDSSARNRHKYVEKNKEWWKKDGNGMKYYWMYRDDTVKWAARLARDAKRRAIKLHATPKWSNDFFMEEAYNLAVLRTKLTGVKCEVDHIVPLQNKLVCGLHAHTNIRVIPSSINRSKNNRYWPDMPHVEVAS